jgi:hypothetical protein
MMYGGLFQNQIVKHLVCLGTNGASTFQGVRLKVIALMKMEQMPYLIGIHCMAHRTNHVVHHFSFIPMVSKLEILLQLFLVPPNAILNFKKLAKIVEVESLKFLWNVKMRWIGMLIALERVGKKYKMLIAKMVVDYGLIKTTKANLLNLYDIHTIWACHVFCPC